MDRTRIAIAGLALALSLGGSASALADFDQDRRWNPAPAGHRAQAWPPRHPPAVRHRPPSGWAWVCRHRVCAWERDDRREARRHPWPPYYAHPWPGRYLPPVVWTQPHASFSWQLNF